ncbi:hypothetical protein CKAH01_14510 [Colletotrichum kahawae]|uniref:Uncharacterized protein n=1 Tax=Colletotrichum kahawae TaxID=34407 RepID=A0AAD9YNJ2_COLKA|nr:hypothetical protein CKAH01_14510 [Colletotrichum kahawae]
MVPGLSAAGVWVCRYPAIMPTSASQHDDNDSADKLGNPLPREFPRERRIAALLQKETKPLALLSGRGEVLRAD